MVDHNITKAFSTYIGTLGTGWTVSHGHSASDKSMPRIVVGANPSNVILKSRFVDIWVRFQWLPDDTTDDAAHTAVGTVRAALDSKVTAGTALNTILNALGIDIIWFGITGASQGVEGERGRYAELELRVQHVLGTKAT